MSGFYLKKGSLKDDLTNSKTLERFNLYFKSLDCFWDTLYNVKNTHHGLVSDVTVLLEAGLALLLLGGNIVGDEGVVALLTEGVLTLDLLLVHRLRHLHHLLDAPHVLVIYVI